MSYPNKPVTNTFLFKDDIDTLIKIRSKLLKKGNDDQRADNIKEQIVASFTAHWEQYDTDYIIETFTHFGRCPNVMYDDNGLFAVSEDGTQPVVCGKEKLEGSISVYCEPHMWKKTINEATKVWVKNMGYKFPKRSNK